LKNVAGANSTVLGQITKNLFAQTKNPICTLTCALDTFEKDYYLQFENQTSSQVYDWYLETYLASEKGRGQLNQLPLSAFKSLGGTSTAYIFDFTCCR
jgi:hypothetical protein